MASLRLKLVRQLMRRLRRRFDFEDVVVLRGQFLRAAKLFNRPRRGLDYTSLTIGLTRAEWTIPAKARPGKAILYLHGGGYCVGSIDTHRSLVTRLTHLSRVASLSLEYRLAPEHPYPAALEDAVAAYEWLLSQSFKAQDIAIAGDSAGGGLVLATLLYLRDQGRPLPGCGILLSPLLDQTLSGASHRERVSRELLLDAALLGRLARHYAGDRELKDGYLSPLWGNLEGLPPLYVQVGEDEILFDDARLLAERARESGISVRFRAFPEMFHGFQSWWPVLPEARRAIDEMADFIGEQLGASPPASRD